MPVASNQVIAVRIALCETQTEFARRFSRSRFAIIRWEAHGAKFKYQSNRWHRWQSAVAQAVELSITRGADNEQIDKLRELQFLRC